MKLYVKKIWSYNPNKYKYITLEKAMKSYKEYLDFYDDSDYSQSFKSFEDWLRSEI